MTAPTIVQVCNAIETALSAGVTYSQTYSEITEGIYDMPLLQVYPEEWTMDVNSNNDRSSFRAGVRQEGMTIIADLYARQRAAGIGEELGVLLPLVDAVNVIFKAQDTKPYFALDGLQAFGPVTGQRVTFVYGDPQTAYVGWRWRIPVRCF